MLKKLDGPPPEEFRKHITRPKKRSLRFLTLLLVFTAMIKPSETITVSCDAGFYLLSSVCVPCPGGKTCAAGVTAGTDCTAGNYCPQGSKTVTQCPAGFYCPASTALPIRCDLASGYLCPAGSSALPSVLAAGSWSKSPKTTTATTGCSLTNTISYQACQACPLGSTCSSGAANAACTGTGKYVSGTTCATATAGNFAPSSYFTQITNPKYTFSAASASTYSYCTAGKSCSISTGGTAATNCAAYQMAGLGAGKCTPAPSGYYVVSNSFVALAKGQYRAVTSNTPVTCPVGNTCTNTAAATCPSMKTSTAGLGYCNRVKVGYYSSSGTQTACATGQKYDKVTSTCLACPTTSGTCDPNTGYTGSCQLGYYIPTQGLGLAFSCTICPAGWYCNDGVNKLAVTQTNTQMYPAKNTGNVDGQLPCPPGYSCTASTMTLLSPGFYNTGTTYPDTGTTNLNGNTYTSFAGNEQNYNCEQDLNPTNSGGACPSDSYWESSFRLKCILSAFNVESFSTGTSSKNTNQVCQGGCMIAWVGEPCTTQSVNNNWRSSAVPTDHYSGVHCPSGWQAWCTTALQGGGAPSTTNRYCAKCGFWGVYTVTGQVTDATECVRGIAQRCRLGGIVKGNITNSLNTATHRHEIRKTNEVALCQDCPPDLICVNNRQVDFTYTPDDWTGWCVGKNPDIAWYDANNGNLKIHMEDRRVSQYKNQVCFDCNGEEFTNGICSFASDYFPDHARTGVTTDATYQNAIQNDFLKAMILKCPFQSATRKQSRYLDSIAWQRLDKTYWTSYTKQIPTYSYTTYAFFDDTEDNIYPYSFCDRDETYFDNTQITSHSEFPDSTEKSNTECTLYEYFTPNFPMCEPNYSGFISDITHDRPTETAVPNGYYTQLTQNDDYTGIKLYDCPEFTEYLMSEGGVGAYGTCHIKNLGSCKDSTSDYCNAGQDYMCPDGLKKKTSGPYTNTINDCTSCQAPEVCSAYGTSTTVCTEGYNCLAMTSDMYSKPGQPGEFLTANNGTGNNDISDCASPNYCEGATWSANVKVCPSGYFNSYTTSGSSQHSLAGCTPVDAGKVGTNSVSCAAGKICPEGTDSNATTAAISIPPGFYSASTGIKSMNDVTVCPAGNFCGFASTTATTNCLAGYYCLEGTVLSKDTPCSFGQTSTAGATSASGCTSCTSGQFCQQGSTAPITVGTYCGTDNFLCIGGSLQRTQCTGGQYTTDGATCLACPAGKFCAAGVQPINCNAGYMSSSSLASCSLSTAGQIASGGATVAAVGVGLWSITGQKVGTACPSGYFCTGGVKTGCVNGQVCAQGSSATVTAGTGTVQDEVNLFYQKLCPSGYICPTGVARSLVIAGQYTKQGDSGAAPSYCASGYSCAVGSIGSYNDACADGTYYVTGVASATCPTCASGSYCYQGQQILCEPGFYCDVTTPAQASFHQLCPVGTYATVTGTSTVACTPCIGGYACLQRGGTTTPIYKCAKGFFCVLGATSTQPEQLSGKTADATYTLQCDPLTYNPTKINTLAALTGADSVTCNQGVCPRGYYCPEGTEWPIVCPVGTYNLNLGEVDVSGCIQCIEGYYCPTPLIKTVCDPGTICPAGKDNQNSVILLSKPSVGHYSQIQYPDEIPCAAGTFQGATGSSSCTSCTAGSQCPITGMSVVQTCARGSDCSLAGVIIPKMCYYGQYLDPVNLVNPTCIACPTDSFCWNDGVIQADITAQNVLRNTFLTSGKCPNGYKCISGASISGMNLIYSTNALDNPQFYSSKAYMCREGYYCNNAEVGVEIVCPIGTYMPRTGAQVVGDCLTCKSGYQCPATATSVPTDCLSGFDCPEGTSTAVDQCQPGFYCPTRAQMQFQCDYGYYTTIVGQTTCIAAPLGSYINALQQIAYITCPIGYYCPLGSPIPIPCNMGTYTSATGSGVATDCIDVPLGQYRISPTQFGVISDGYYSPNTAQRFTIPTHNGGSVCITGHYCVGGAQTLCAAGTICWKEMTTTNVVSGVDECDPGFYCHAGCNRKRPTDIASMFGDICPKQKYCPISTVDPVNCPIGTYSDAFGLKDVTECNKCKNGMYCPVPAIGQAGMLPCPAGSYCIESTTVASAAPLCGIGYYCPIVNGVGAKQQIPCPAGQYQDVAGQSSCKTCNLGNYCPFSYTTPGLQTQCPVGNVCPDINLFNPNPCSPGQFLNALGQSGSCEACTEGFYCPFEGMSVPIACPDQYFCPVSTITPALCADGYICDITDPTTQVVQTPCPAGFYCIQGKKFQCYAGYLCIAGAVIPNPIDGTTGKICDQGYWCSDSINQIACGIGNYQPYYGATAIGMCQTCPSGTTCPLAANSKYTYIVCPAGYICDTTGNTPCDPGYYCPQGTLVMLMCPPGTYQDQTASTSCKVCTDYHYCAQDVANHIGTITPVACPAGHYCPEGTSNYQIFKCSIGTYHDTTLITTLKTPTECSPCPEKFYCPVVGMTDLEKNNYPCQDGYICDAGSSQSIGTSECPNDYWCVAGTKTKCTLGTYSTATGLTSANECVACSPGKICINYSIGIVDCDAGYYCIGSVVDPTSANRIKCPVGNYCPIGSAQPIKCLPGMFQDLEGQLSCKICPAGSYCPTSGLDAHIICAGDATFDNFWCPEGTITPKKCDIGLYVSADSITCESCPRRNYCWPTSDNTNGNRGICAYTEGYLCQGGSYSDKPLKSGLAYIQPGSLEFTTYNGPVLGGYISIATGYAQACPVGTFQPSILSQDCIDCYDGYFCPNTGMSSIADYRCAQGFYCLRGSTLEQPPDNTQYSVSKTPASPLLNQINGGLCPVTKQCSYNLVHQMECADGYISQVKGLSQCSSCPNGFYCDIAENQVIPTLCISQSICTGGEKRQPICPIGTFMNVGQQFCQKCTAGNYCRAGIIAEQCAAGYVCATDGFNSVPDPAGTECNVGSYCPKGTLLEVPCPYKTMSMVAVGKQTTDCAACQPGWLCPVGQRNATECPIGHYCPPQGDDVVYPDELYACALGTYNPLTKQVYQANCLDCDAGFYCNITALANLTGRDCPKGYYCPKGTIQPVPCRGGTYQNSLGAQDEDSCDSCPVGTYCLQASVIPTPCEEGFSCPYMSAIMLACTGGFYCNKETRFQETECPVNSYCPRGSAYPIPCDRKHTCPAQTEEQIFCVNGNYVDTKPSEYGMQNVCKRCRPGTYSIADTDGCLPCPAGFLCYGGTNSDYPKSISYNRGEICPKGSYCPEGSYEEEPCPPGTFNAEFGAKSLNQCNLCIPGSSNALFGQEGCNPCGQFANSNEGATRCTCNGAGRVYSPVDNSCRCKTGFDFKSVDGVSLGQSSDNTDCIPLVLDRCDQAGQVRDPSGACVQMNDCKKECKGLSGTRDAILGICQCNNQPTVDEICNQACRAAAPKISFDGNDTTKIFMLINNKSTPLDLTQVGDVYGRPSTGTGAVKTVTMGGDGGFIGSYSAPSLITNALSGVPNITNNSQKINSTQSKARKLSRDLQDTSPLLSDQIQNPSYCISIGDTFIFTIGNAAHYPVYMKDSVLNTNSQFDYGSFIELASEMVRKTAQELTTTSFFSFTFNQKGSYIFQDAADSSQLMQITVKGLGEKCQDPDRFLQVMSGSSLSAIGVTQRSDLIINPNYPLIVSMTLLLFFGTGFTMWMVSYCMRKGWTIHEMEHDNYREIQLSVNIHHENEKLFIENNDFVNHKSELIDHEEDDLEMVNMDIQLDLIEAGQKYLHKWDKRKQKYKRAKVHKKKEIQMLLSEVESLVAILNSDSTAAQMHWLDLDVLQDGAQIDDKQIKFQIEKQMNAINKQEDTQNENYKAKKEELLNAASERERLLHEQARDNMLKNQSDVCKQNNITDEVITDIKAASEYAIYDNGDIKSKNNQLVKKVEENQILNDEEKEKLLNNHEQALHNIDSLLEIEKRKQEHELDRALKERLDRRHRIKEKLHTQDIKKEHFEIEKEISVVYDQKKHEAIERFNRMHEQQIKEIITNSDLAIQRQQIQSLEELTEQKKRQFAIDLDQEQLKEIEAKKQIIQKKYLDGHANEEDLANELKRIMGDQASNFDQLNNQANKERSDQEAKLKIKLAQRQKKILDDSNKEADKAAAEVDKEDLIQAHERQVIATDAHLRLKAKAQAQDGHDGCLGLDKQGLPITNAKIVQAADVARKEVQERKTEMTEMKFRIDQNIDTTLQQQSLLSELEESNSNLVILLKQQEDLQLAKLNARKDQLRARRLTKIKIEKDEKVVRGKIESEELKQNENNKITEQYVRTIFKNVPKNETVQAKEKRLELLNEYMSDQFLEELAALLSKQYMENDALLKLNMHKYLTEGLNEANAIKTHFKIDAESLNRLQTHMDESDYNNQMKKLKLNEANLLKKTDLAVMKGHAEEEARLRKELDKKHMQEQIELRVGVSQRQAALRIQLVGETSLGEQESELDRKALEKFQQYKSTEQERRMRAIELQKKTLQNQVDADMKQIYEDYDDMKRKQKKAEQEAILNEDTLKKRIQERKDKIKKSKIKEDLTQEEQDAMLKLNYQEQLAQLDSAYAAEQRRQQLIMKTKQDNRKKRLIKVQQLKKELDKKETPLAASQLEGSLARALRNKMFQQLDDSARREDDSELYRRLKDWNLHKRDYEYERLTKKAAEAGLVELDERQIQIMVIKLQQIERLLKEVGRQRKLKLKSRAEKPEKAKMIQSFSSKSKIQKLVTMENKKLVETIAENFEDEDDANLIVKPSAVQGNLKPFMNSSQKDRQQNFKLSGEQNQKLGTKKF